MYQHNIFARPRIDPMISLERYSDLLATLHSAPLEDDHWRLFLVELCDFTQSTYGIFSANDSAQAKRILAHSGVPAFAEAHRQYNASFKHRDPFRQHFLRNPRVGLFDGVELLPYNELIKTDIYREFFRPLELHHGTYMVLSMTPRKYEFISMWRGAGRPRLDPDTRQLLSLLMPHVQTALAVRQVLHAAEHRARNAEALLDMSSTAAWLLDESGRIVFLNESARRLVGERDGVRLADEQLAPTDVLRRAEFRGLLLAAAALNQEHPGGALTLERPNGKRALQVLVTPFRPADADRSHVRVLVLATDPETKVNFPDAILRSLYDLTPAETELANGLITGFTLDELALLRKVSVSTVRSQMKTLLAKTNTRRQSELVGLLSSLPRTSPGGGTTLEGEMAHGTSQR
jgi:DNA-binding CsgD family transcriptional regulator/PAS domain-containing protein